MVAPTLDLRRARAAARLSLDAPIAEGSGDTDVADGVKGKEEEEVEEEEGTAARPGLGGAPLPSSAIRVSTKSPGLCMAKDPNRREASDGRARPVVAEGLRIIRAGRSG